MEISKYRIQSFFAGLVALLFLLGSTSVAGAAIVDPNFPPLPLPPEEEQPVPECVFPPGGVIVLPTPGNSEPQPMPPSPEKMREAADKLEQKGRHEEAHALREHADALETVLEHVRDACPGDKAKEHRKNKKPQPEPPCPDCTFPDPGGIIVLPPGEDGFGVQPFGFQFSLPQDYFGPGSDPFTGTVILDEVNVGTSDTIIRRLEPIEFEGELLPNADVVSIEIVQLNLFSVEPITINLGDGSEQQWDVQIDLSDELPSPGEMTITESFVGGGTFDGHFNVFVDIRLSPALNESDPNFEVKFPSGDGTPIDGPAEHLIGEKIELKATLLDVPWMVCPGTNSEFCLGTTNEETQIPEIEFDCDNITNQAGDITFVCIPPPAPIVCEPAVCGSDPVDDDTGCNSTTEAADCGCYPNGTECADGEDPVAEDPIVTDPVVNDPFFDPGTGDEDKTGLLN